MTFEVTDQQIKDVQVMNTIMAVEGLLRQVGEAVKHIGNDINGRLADIDKGNITASEDEVQELEHWLTICGNVMSGVAKGIQVNNLGYKVVRIADDAYSPEDIEVIKKAAMHSEVIQKIKSLLTESPEAAMMRTLAESMGVDLSDEALQEILNGN